MSKPAFIAALALLFAVLPAVSQQPATASTYNVELVIFRATGGAGGSENWSSETGARGGGLSGEDSGGGGSQPARFIGTLPASELKLTDVASKLRSTGVYVPIAHVGWSQTAAAWGSKSGLPLQSLGLQVAGLSGSILLERGQYLHLGMRLSYAMANPASGLGAAPGTTFTLNESRRVRFYERNYYDHPAFGVVALVTPAGSRPAAR